MRRSRLAPRVAASLVALASAAAAQTPLGSDLVEAGPTAGYVQETSPHVVCDDRGVCGQFWLGVFSFASRTDFLGAVLGPDGGWLARPRLLATSELGSNGLPVGLERGFALLWIDSFPDGHTGAVLQEFEEDLTPTGPPVRLPLGDGMREDPNSLDALDALVRTREGFALLSDGVLGDELRPVVFLFFFRRDGTVIRPRRRVDEDGPLGAFNTSPYALAVQPNGDLVAVYRRFGSEFPSDVYVRRFGLDGTPLGPEQLIDTARGTSQGHPSVAVGRDGSFLVVWQRMGAPETASLIFGRRFSAAGAPLGPPFRINDESLLDQRFPVVTADARGNYFVAWQAFSPVELGFWDVHGRLLRADGTPVAGEQRLNQFRRFDQESPRVAFGSNGVVFAGWESGAPQQRGTDPQGEHLVPVVRRFAASPGQETCATSGSLLACDLARTGGTMELELTWGGRPGEVTLFGDWDGDGRDDVCGYYQGRFRCDVGHTGQASGFERFGEPGDVPLLGDVDGDGRADPCVRRAGSLLCDTRRDGRAHFERRFTAGGGTPLLGDLDGDGRADLCRVEDGTWDCLLSATGHRLHFHLGQPGASFALGDADGDGRADPCALLAGLLSCNTRHDGGPATWTLKLDVSAAASLLFGNLDGL